MSTQDKYIPWDLDAFMKGWPAEWQGKPAKFVAHVPDAKPLSRLLLLQDGTVYAVNPDSEGQRPKLLARELDPHPCNRDGLYRDQVGDGWRIKGHNEEPKDGDEVWCCFGWSKRKRVSPFEMDLTYRTSDPLPATKVDLGPEDIILGKTVVRVMRGGVQHDYLVIERNHNGVQIKDSFIYWPDLRAHCEISFDHGVTWQKAEKEAKQ